MAATAAQDRLFLFSLGVSTFVIIGLMRRMLIHYRDAAIIPPTESKPQYITQDVEDSLKLTTLNKLLNSPSFSIHETTAVIVLERALHDGSTIEALLYYLSQPDHDMREHAIRALSIMINSSTIGMINEPKTYAALVKCLEYCITDYEHNEYDSEWDNWGFRDVVERGCLSVLSQLVEKFGVEGLVKSRFVDRWLAKEPWGGTDEKQRQHNFRESLDKPHHLNRVCLPLCRDERGRRQLEEAGMIPQIPPLQSNVEPARDTRMINGEGTAGEDLATADSRRRRDQSSEGEHLRRRHREAMVLNDGTRPLERGDIIERER